MGNPNQSVSDLLRAEDGPTAVEYAILLAFIAIGVLASFANFGDKMEAIYLTIFGALTAAFAG
ncbi:MAG: Flp family type IVb pilin [Planctomycetes bacterium]|nr:Flp family type IVb pilin [Planctomycetota bacterium]